MHRTRGPAVTNEPNEVKAVLTRPGKILTNEAGSLFAIDPAPSDGLVLASDSSVDGGLGWVSVTGVAGVGDVNGPASSTTTALARFTDTTGKSLQNSVVLVSNGGAMTGVSSLAVGTANVSGSVNASHASATNLCLQTAVAGDTNYRLGVSNAGNINIGGGSAATDLRLRRTGPATLQIDDGSTGAATLNIGTITATNINGKVAADLTTGPASSTDNAVARFDSTTGKALQGSSVTISDTGDIAGAQSITVTAITANTIGGKSVPEIVTAAASTGTANRLTRWNGNQIIKDSSVTLDDAGNISGVVKLTAVDSVEAPFIHTNTINVNGTGTLELVGSGLNMNSTPIMNVSSLQYGLTTIDIQDVVTGALSSVNNTIVRYDGNTGKKIKGTSIVVSDTDEITGATSISSTQFTSTGALLLLPFSNQPIQGHATGNTRGSYATDWQRSRSNVTQVASGIFSVIGGGVGNSATNQGSVVAGGDGNLNSGYNATISGGAGCKASGEYAFVTGRQNEAHSNYSAVLGGDNNKIAVTGSGIGSVVVGGVKSTIVHDGCLTYNSSSTGSVTTSAARQAIINLSTVAYSPIATPGTMFVNGDLQVTGSFSVFTLNATLITPSTANTSLTIAPTGSGALIASTAGNVRGSYSTDLQRLRSATTMVASGTFSTITGGENNTASGPHSVVGGGLSNTAAANRSCVLGGESNIVNTVCDYSTIAGGYNNIIGTGALYSFIAGGANNRVNHGLCFAYGGQAGVTTTGSRQIIFNCSASMYTAPNTNPGVYTNGAITCAGLYVPPPTDGTSTLLTDYENGTFNVTTFGAISGQTVAVKFQRLGKRVTLQIDAFAYNVTSAGTGVSLSSIPARLRPVTQFAAIVQTRNGDVAHVGHMQVSVAGSIGMFDGPSGGDTWNIVGAACGTYSATTLTYLTA
jgi:hypothetical protein